MQETGYDNSAYWRDIHERLGDQLRAVGHPWLSNSLNALKYQSEADSVLNALRLAPDSSRYPREPSVLDIGAGTGYWTALVAEWLRSRGCVPRQAALDLSRPALESISLRNPGIELLEVDLKTVDRGLCAARFDLVMALYCLHHILDPAGFENALRFAARSVRSGGCLLLVDPILTDAYSPFHGADWKTWPGNGLPRSLDELDAILKDDGFERLMFVPVVSFLLNGPIQARYRWQYALAQHAWHVLGYVYRSERMTRTVSGLVRYLDKALKGAGKGLSSSLCLYHRS